MLAILILAACSLPAESLRDAYIEAYCEHFEQCNYTGFTMESCIAAVEGSIVPPTDGCTLDRDLVEACLAADIECPESFADPCSLYANTVDDRDWDCPPT